MRISFVIIGILLAALIIAILNYVNGTQKESPEPATGHTPSEPAQPAELNEQSVLPDSPFESLDAEELSDPFDEPAAAAADTEVEDTEPELPPLHESDVVVLESLADWSLPDRWVDQTDLLARLTTVILNAAQGRVPKRQLQSLAPGKPFQAIKRGETYVGDPRTFNRFERHLGVMESVGGPRAAKFVLRFKPLFEEALAQLGERRSLDELVESAAQRINALPITRADFALVRPNVVYQFADAELESRTEFDKQLLRMGPENVARVKKLAAEFMAAYRDLE